MAIIGPTTYDARGRLIKPDSTDIARAKRAFYLDTGTGLTLDRGKMHVHVMQEYGRTARVATERINARLARFFDAAEFTDGYRKIAMRKTQGILPINQNTSITYEVVYAIEDSRARTHNPEHPTAGAQRGRGHAIATW